MPELFRRASVAVTDHCDLLATDWEHRCGINAGKCFTLNDLELCYNFRSNRRAIIKNADAKARARWKLDATIAKQKENIDRQ